SHCCPNLPRNPYDKSEKTCMLSEYMEKYPRNPITVPREPFHPRNVYEVVQIPMEGISTT
ncbi:PREDICTED: protein FAM154A-like, partial [Apaloderma vittatum]|uniref:protein FAM154A-like n=1 Tax=Apaloderma vittatum TaxID=57397 RepID=UPI0005212D1A